MAKDQLGARSLRLAQILKQFAAEAPYIQIESQRASAQLYEKIKAELAAERGGDGELTEEDDRAITELARACTPYFQVPSMHAEVKLTLSYIHSKGWVFSRRTTQQSTNVTLELDLEAAPLTPAAGVKEYDRVLPPTPEALFAPGTLSSEEKKQCKRLMAGTEATDDTRGERVRSVARFLQHAASRWHASGGHPTTWGTGWYNPMVGHVRTALNDDWDGAKPPGKYFLGAMKTILREALLAGPAAHDESVDAMREAIRQLKEPTGFLLDYLLYLKSIEDHLGE